MSGTRHNRIFLQATIPGPGWFDGPPRRKALVVREPLCRQREGVLGYQRRDGDLDPLGAGPGDRGRLATACMTARRSGRVTRWRGAVCVLPKQALPM